MKLFLSLLILFIFSGCGFTFEKLDMLVNQTSEVVIDDVVASNNSALITFHGEAKIISYSVFSGATSTTVSTQASSSATSPYTLSGLTNGTDTYVEIIGATAAFESIRSRTIRVRPVATFNTTSAVAGVERATITFPVVTGATSYSLVYGTTSGSYTNRINNITSPYQLNGLTIGQTYYFKVVASNEYYGLSTSTNEVSATPVAGFNITSAVGTGTQVVLNWGAFPGTTNYQVKYGTASGVYTTFSTVTGTTETITGLDLTQDYYFMITADGVTDALAELHSLPQVGSVTSTPTLLTSVITWTASTGPGTIRYDVYRSTTSGGALTSIATNLSALTYTDSSGAMGTKYYYKVVAKNNLGSSTESVEATGTAPAAPTGLTATSGISNIALSWTAATGAGTIQYDIYRAVYSGSCGAYSVVNTGVVTATTYNDLSPSVIDGTTYCYKVVAMNYGGSQSIDSSVVSAVVYSTLGTSGVLHYDNAVNYLVSSATYVDVNAGSNSLARLKSADQTDDSTDMSGGNLGFESGGGTGTVNVTYNANSRLTLTNPGNTNLLDPSWTPQYSTLTGYWTLDNDCTGNIIYSFDAVTTRVGTQVGSFYDNSGIDDEADCSTDLVGTSVKFRNINQVYFLGIGNEIFPNALTSASVAIWVTPSAYDLAYVNGVTLSALYQFDNESNSSVLSILSKAVSNKLSLDYRISSGARPRVHTRSTFSPGVPLHIVVTVSSGLGIVYVNGVEEIRVTDLDISKTLQEMISYDGIGLGNSTAIHRGFMGKIGEFATFATALTATEVETIYRRQSANKSGTFLSRIMDSWNTVSPWANLSYTGYAPYGKELVNVAEPASEYTTTNYHKPDWHTNLVGLWHFNETSGSSFADSSGNNLTATAHGDYSLNCFATGVNHTKACSGSLGKFKRAVQGVGTLGDYISLPNSAHLDDVQEVNSTYSLWVKFTSLPTNASAPYAYGGILMKGTVTHPFGLAINSSGNLVFFVTRSSGIVGTNTSTETFGLHVWHHLFLTFNKGTRTFSLSVNGLPVFTNVNLGGSSFATYEYGTSQWNVGALDASNYPLSGAVDELAIWNNLAINNSFASVMNLRGVLSAKFQVRTCSAANCSDRAADPTGGWIGGNGTQVSFFPWDDMATPVSSVIDFLTQPSLSTWLANENKRYVQYRVGMDNYDFLGVAPDPDVYSVTLGNPHYITSSPYVTSTVAIQYMVLTGFSQSVTCSSGVKYQLSADGSSWYYYNSGWVSATTGNATTASTAAVINTNISTFPTAVSASTTANNNLFVRAYLESSGSSACEVDSVTVTGGKL